MAISLVYRNGLRVNRLLSSQLIAPKFISREKCIFTRTLAFDLSKSKFDYRCKSGSIANHFKTNIYNNEDKRLFQTSPKRYNPIVTILLRQTAKVLAVITGRAVRKWWQKLPNNKRQLVIEWFKRHKWKFAFSIASLTAVMYAYYLSHIQETPITKRKRFIAFTTKQLEAINKYDFEVHLEMYKNKLLPNNHAFTKRVANVATKLLSGNGDLKQIHDHEWTISVIDDMNVKNAFVMPSGQIFVFTGMLSLCDNDQQLGVILAHEMAHSVLSHSAELLSHAHLIDLAFICVIGALWTIMPTDIIAVITTSISRLVLDVMVDRPYNRMLETEADIVGLELAAKACFDVRETSAFWHKMAIMDSAIGFDINPQDIHLPPQAEFLSTHPSHESRYAYLDSIMNEAIELREKCNCPKLPKQDPRFLIETMKKQIAEQQKNKTTDGVVVLKKPPMP